jgi:hypothetical protein
MPETKKIRGPWSGVNLWRAWNPNLMIIEVALKEHLGTEGKLALVLKH